MEYADFVEKCVKEYKETENEFVYQLIDPFCETVVEKKLSKAELKQILEKGMQKSIPLAKVKQAREEIYSKYDSTVTTFDDYGEGKNDMVCIVIEILDKLIEESED